MRMSKVIILVILLFILFNGNINASEQSLSIKPSIIKIDALPPSSPSVPIIIRNNTREEVNLEMKLIPFRTTGLSGQVIFAPENENKSFYPLYKQKIQFLLDSKKTDRLVLEGLETKEVLVNINFEKGDPPGDYYYSILFITKSKATVDSSLSTIPSGIVSNLILTVGPKDKAVGAINRFATSSYKNNGPVDFILKVRNSGNHVIEPSGYIEISNVLGKKVGNVVIPPQYILAHTDRYLSNDFSKKTHPFDANRTTDITYMVWPERFVFGLYKATASVKLDKEGPLLKSSVYFFAFPLYFFLPLIAGLFVLLSIYLRVRKKL